MGLTSAMPQATYSGAPPGGSAASHDENTRTATAAVSGGTPAPTSVAPPTVPTAAIVAVADSGAATAITIRPIRIASSHTGRFIWFSRLVILLGGPVAGRALAPAKANTTVIPTTPNLGAEFSRSCHQPRPPRGRRFQPRRAPVMMRTTGIQTMTLTDFVMSSPLH